MFTSAFAFAASLGTVTTDSVGAGNVAVGAFDTDGVHRSFTSAWRIADRTESGSSTAVEARFAARENTTVARRPRLTIGYYP